MNSRHGVLFLLVVLFEGAVQADEPVANGEEALLSGTRQLIFEGKRAGEGYFSADGKRMVFQSERQDDNPFYQIYLMDLDTGDVDRISPGLGKTTCSWIHPRERKVLFASTHDDSEAEKKQEDELAFRASGQTRRYAWDYDENFELYEAGFDGGGIRRLTDARGYDAEGSWSPDGSLIAFASNRAAYSETLAPGDKETFERDPSFLMDIYLMNADGSKLRRLTDVKGYDGGPFFSPDGKRICWRRFSEDGARAEVFVMNIDGTDQRPITKLGAMSWAPYFHPSGDYLIFTTNLHGFANFELYLVDAAGEHEPVRVTYTDGFDGLPVFTPDGKGLAWTSNRTPNKTSQIFTAAWNDEAARTALGLASEAAPETLTLENPPDISANVPAVSAADIKRHIEYLASDYMEGRGTGTLGERRSTTYLSEVLESLGLRPAGDNGTYLQAFTFTAGVSLGQSNRLTVHGPDGEKTLEVDADWRPLAYTKTGPIDKSDVVFGGYGIVAPKSEEFEEYDSYVHLDVENKWVLMFRYMPENIMPEIRQHLSTHSSLRYKAMTARDLGAHGVIFVSGPNSKVANQLIELTFDASLGATSIGALCVTDAVVESWLEGSGKTLKSLQDELDGGEASMGFAIEGVSIEATIDIQQEERTGHNVLARLDAGDAAGKEAVVIGAHADHLGKGRTNTSLARDDEKEAIHYGADDNASGVAGVLEIAQYLVDAKASGSLEMKRDAIFALWSGEELGLLGSAHFAKTYGDKPEDQPLTPDIAVYLNMDMIGRLREKAVLQGTGSSSIWAREIEQRNVPVGLSVSLQDESYLPTDATSFYLREVPFLNAFTGAHEDYHSPRDTADKINYEGAEQIARFMALVARSLLTRDGAPDYLEAKRPENMEVRANLRAYLGTIPDYAESNVAGVKVSGVTKGAPSEKAGLKQGDIIVELAGKKIENIYDYTFAIEALKIGEEVTMTIVRGGEGMELKVTPGSRE